MIPGNLNLAIVVPCYNEEKRFNLDYWLNIVDKTPDINWLFVDDGSTDNTLLIISNLLDRPNVNIYKLEFNSGKSEAIRLGMLWCNSKIEDTLLRNGPSAIGFIDCDGAFDLSDIMKFTQLCTVEFGSNKKVLRYHAIISSRVKLSGRKIIRNPLRHYIGRIVVTIICKKWKSAPYDTQSGFKIFYSSPQLIYVLDHPFETRWFFDIEIFMRMISDRSENFSIWEEPLENWSDVGNSKIGTLQYFSVLKEILKVKRIINRNQMQELRRK